MHLSHPPGHSVNDGIPIDKFSLKYISVDTAMDAAIILGHGAVMAKIDIIFRISTLLSSSTGLAVIRHALEQPILF